MLGKKAPHTQPAPAAAPSAGALTRALRRAIFECETASGEGGAGGGGGRAIALSVATEVARRGEHVTTREWKLLTKELALHRRRCAEEVVPRWWTASDSVERAMNLVRLAAEPAQARIAEMLSAMDVDDDDDDDDGGEHVR